ncbi:MAG TPA: VTT domain-containing protein [Pyrinomonadaceae bacterium]|jgi:membrane protein DedA with SNARE-associated domain|nr:VTT domain-containing protein [Pyrinomonadaceae bacterium]
MEQHFYELVGQYGLYAVFFLAMIEGDLTLLLAGVLAHGAFFGEYSFLKVLAAGTAGGVAGDQVAYAMGRGFRSSIRDRKFYRAARPRIERLTETFGPLSIFLSKYVYGLRTGSCIFYGVAKMSYTRFLPLTIASCFLWVLLLSGAGYFFHGIITNFIGDFEHLGKFLLVVVGVGVLGFYLAERYWLSPKVEEADPERVHEFEENVQEKLQELGEELKEHLAPPLTRRTKDRKDKETVKKMRAASGSGGDEGD